MGIQLALNLEERQQLARENKIVPYKDEANRVKYWCRFFYNNQQYMQYSLKSISQVTAEQLVAMRCGEDACDDLNNRSWYEDWKLIINGSLPSIESEDFLFCRGVFVSHFLRLASWKLERHCGGYCNILLSEQFAENCLRQMADQLHYLSCKMLVLEVNVLREQGMLEGETPEERHHYFEQILLNDLQFIAKLGEEYGVLIRSLIEKINLTVEFISEVLQHLDQDWEQLEVRFPHLGQSGVLHTLKLGMGDTHNKGRSVVMLEFAHGRIVYKPRSLAVDEQFQELISWVNSQVIDIPLLYEMKIFNRGNYGWSEYIPYAACNSLQEVERFYRSMGAQLALLYVLNATDFHYGNIIAKGEYPVLIDLESLFHQDLYEETYSEDALGQADRMLASSIMASGMLPNLLYQRGEQGKQGIDLSGLGGRGNQPLPFEVLQMTGVGTDRVAMERGLAYLEEGLNLPRYQGEWANLHDYLDDIESGFAAVYRFLAQHKHTLLQQLRRFEHTPVRTVARPTAIYGELLRSLHHPDLLRDALDRDVFLHRLWLKCLNQPILERLLVHEKDDLLRDDVPLFNSRPGCKHLWSSDGSVIPDVFRQTALQLVEQKIDQLGEKDLYNQLQVLHMVMLASSASHYADVEVINYEAYLPLVEGQEFLQQATDIGDYLLRTKIIGQNNGRQDATWISTVLEGSKEVAWRLSPVGLDFYNGNSGIVLFLGYLAELTGKESYREAAREGLIPVLNDLFKLHEHPNWSLGAYSGIGGSMFTVSRLAQIWQDEALFQAIESTLPAYIQLISTDRIYDYIGGAAGALDILLHIYKLTGLELALDGAVKCGKHLVASAQELEGGGIGWPSEVSATALTGYSHGNAGMAAVLSALYRVTGERTLLHSVSQALVYERRYYDHTVKNWLTPGREGASIAWCHGAPGVLLSRLRLRENGYNDDLLEQEIHTALDTTLKQGLGNNRSYCHGDFGQLEILLYANKTLNQVKLASQIQSVQYQLVELVRSKMWNYGVARGTDAKGVMVGVAGIGMGLLKQYQPEFVPDLLCLENRTLHERR